VVRGENIGQTFLFVDTGSVRIGFVAMSQVMRDGRIKEGSAWIVPTDDYSAIKQNATLLKIGEKNIGARSFLEYLKSTKALGIMKTYGYD
jgi:molybdate transport system substrate-binding protein